MEILKREYAEAFELLGRIKWLILVLAALFAAVSAAAYFLAMELYRESPEAIGRHLQGFGDMVASKDIVDEQGNISALGLFFANFIAAVTAVCMGLVPFLFLPMISLAINAAVIGGMLGIIESLGAGGLYEMLVMVAPHGIIEIPALLMCIALGLRLCFVLSKFLLRRTDGAGLIDAAAQTAKTVVLAATPMLAAAAVTEAYITPMAANILLR